MVCTLPVPLLRLLPKNTLSRALGAACRLSAPRPVVRAAIRGVAIAMKEVEQESRDIWSESSDGGESVDEGGGGGGSGEV